MSNKWFIKPRNNNNVTLRLFCFPYAGGNASTYVKWSNDLPEHIELVLIQPPGRANRLAEPAFDNMDALVESLQEAITPYLDKPYVFFGHSLGSRTAYELTKRLQIRGENLPQYLIASGSAAAHLPRTQNNSWNKSDAEFVALIKSIKGTPEAFFLNPEMMNLLLPMLRADFKVSEQYHSDVIKLACSIWVLAGTEDDISVTELNAWQDLTNAKCSIEYVAGDHFFIDKNSAAVLKKVNTILADITVM
ncbi:hypothetical protein PULV_a4277 [Pseudoalteromonas ulvae UL12]|uniref:thioesterase II family protein n=1 Tax=Pseudoalteromonas ulvae TaxID=107327 RepID=UPI00186BA918|nr:thioesterase [Pseudoalteromonas ulvae]MBE0361869.1 hypothetical protein [Pseudoalteromonas ulvae UL12]